MRPLPVLFVAFTLWKVALFIGVLALLRFSPADPGPLEGDSV